jgi:AcrR family transcriptional regulator
MRAITPASSRERLLHAAVELFLRDGFGPVGLDRIIDAVGVTKTTFYKHFESKDDLILRALAYQHEVEMRGLTEDVAARAGDDPRRQILAMFDVFDEWFAAPNFRGCIFLSAVTEFPLRTDPIHIAAAAHGAGLQRFVAERAIAAGAAAPAADTLADQVLLVISGAVLSRQTAGLVEAARLARPMVEMLVERALPTTAPPG